MFLVFVSCVLSFVLKFLRGFLLSWDFIFLVIIFLIFLGICVCIVFFRVFCSDFEDLVVVGFVVLVGVIY